MDPAPLYSNPTTPTLAMHPTRGQATHESPTLSPVPRGWPPDARGKMTCAIAQFPAAGTSVTPVCGSARRCEAARFGSAIASIDRFVDERDGLEQVLAEALDETRRLREDETEAAIVDLDRVREVEAVLGARDRDVHQAALLLDVGVVLHAVHRREPPVGGPQQEHGVPLEAFRRVDGRERQHALVVAVAGKDPGDAVRRRLERHVGEERRRAAVAFGDRGELLEVAFALRVVLGVQAAEHGRVVCEDEAELLAGCSGARDLAEELRQVLHLPGALAV